MPLQIARLELAREGRRRVPQCAPRSTPCAQDLRLSEVKGNKPRLVPTVAGRSAFGDAPPGLGVVSSVAHPRITIIFSRVLLQAQVYTLRVKTVSLGSSAMFNSQRYANILLLPGRALG